MAEVVVRPMNGEVDVEELGLFAVGVALVEVAAAVPDVGLVSGIQMAGLIAEAMAQTRVFAPDLVH